MLTAGTISMINNGTLASSGTTTGVGVVSVLSKGTVSLGSVGGIDANAAAQTGFPVAIGGTDSGGTIRTVLVNSAGAMSVAGAAAGTFVNISTGTLNVGSVIMTSGTLNLGTVNMASGTLNLGTVNMASGTLNVGTATVSGKDANAAAQTSNPLAIGGTDSGGTVRTINVDSTGAVKVVGASAGTFVNLSTGTLNTIIAGTQNTLGTLGTIQNILAGTIGTVLGIGGTVQVSGASAGTFVNLTTGTLNAGTFNLGTVVGNIASGTTDSGNPVKVGAVFQGTAGTVTNGQRVDLQADAVGNLKVYLATKLDTTNDAVNVGTVSVIPNIPGGTINILAGGTLGILTNGTISSSGTTTGVGVVSMLTAGTVSMINAGTLTSSGTTTGVGTISNIGSLGMLTAGTITSVTNLAGGSVNVLPLPGSILTTAITIGTAGTAGIPASVLTNRKSFVGYNIGVQTVYIGGTGVTTTSGIPIPPNSYTPALDLGTGILYGVAAAAGGTIIALEVS